MHERRTSDKLPDPWLFNSEKLLHELDNCRELILKIPVRDSEVHFATNRAIDALWDLRSTIEFLLQLHRSGQRAFGEKAMERGKIGMTQSPKHFCFDLKILDRLWTLIKRHHRKAHLFDGTNHLTLHITRLINRSHTPLPNGTQNHVAFM